MDSWEEVARLRKLADECGHQGAMLLAAFYDQQASEMRDRLLVAEKVAEPVKEE